MEDNNQEKMKKEVLGAIESGKVKQRPRWYFAVQTVAVAAGIIIVFLALLFFVSLAIFLLHQSGAWFVPMFGLRGWFSLLRSMPWLLVIFSLIFIVALEVLVRRYSFGYQKPLLYSLLAIVIAVFVGGFLIFQTPLHPSLFNSRNNLPVLGDFYRGFGMPDYDDIHRGVIVSMTNGGFVIHELLRDSTTTVVITPQTELPAIVRFMIGDQIVVFGGVSPSGNVQAIGIEKVAGN